jgi:hypothetical protein
MIEASTRTQHQTWVGAAVLIVGALLAFGATSIPSG